MSRDLLVLSLAMATWGVGEGMFYSFQPLYLQQLGADPLTIGGILGIIGVAMTIAHLPAGYLSDRIGRRPVLISAWLLGTFSAWIMALAGSLSVFVVGAALYGATTFVAGPLNSYATAARGKLSIGRAITMLSAFYNLGSVIGPLLGGWVGARAGLHANFSIAACIFILSAFLVFFIRPQPTEPHDPERPAGRLKGVFHTRFLSYLALLFFVFFSLGLPQPLSQNFLQNERHVNLVHIGQLISLRSAGIVVFNLLIGQLNARLGFILAQFCVAAFTVLIWQGSGIPLYMLAYFFLGSYGTARSLAAAIGRHLVETANMGIAYSAIEAVTALSVILAPPLAGYLYAINPVWVYPLSLSLILVALLSSSLFAPRPN